VGADDGGGNHDNGPALPVAEHDAGSLDLEFDEQASRALWRAFVPKVESGTDNLGKEKAKMATTILDAWGREVLLRHSQPFLPRCAV